MENINLIVVDGSKEVTNSIKKYFEVRSRVNVIESFTDGEEALSFIINHQNEVDIIVMDILLPKMDGISLLHNLNKRNIKKKIIVLSSYMTNDIAQNVSSLGVDYYMLKPFNTESLEQRILDLFKINNFKSNKKANLEIKVTELLHNLGIPSHLRGYQYIRDGVMYLYNKNSYVSFITKEIYPELAVKYETTPSRVERAIRHAIEISWERGDIELIEELFGHSINFNKSKPTNSEFINTIADRIRLDNKVVM